MQVVTSTEHTTVRGEEGERLTLRVIPSQGADPTPALELSLEAGDYYFRTRLDDAEVTQLGDFLSVSYRDAVQQSLSFDGANGERLLFRHSNMGEPYREGFDVRVEGVEQFPDYMGPFVETSEANLARDFIRQQQAS